MSRYTDFLHSEKWREIKRERLGRAGYGCEECGATKKLVGHHLEYPRNPYDLTANDIQILCDKCHNALHREKARRKKDRAGAKTELQKLRTRQAHAKERFAAVGRRTSHVIR